MESGKVEFIQLVHTLSYGDAISNEALTIKRLALEAGYRSRIIAVHAHPFVKGEVELLAELGGERLELPRGATILLHYSIASPLNSIFCRAPAGVNHRITLYHNLTPVEFYRSYNARVAADLERAKSELESVLAASDLILADSQFNAEELKPRAVQVLPLVMDSERWAQIAPNAGIRRALQGGVNLLSVGRVAPNKNLAEIIKVFYFYHRKIEPRSKLWLVGSEIDNEIYSFELRRLVAHLRLEGAVEFVGGVSDGELRSYFEGASAYLAFSLHEGFCVPVIEAMYFGVPVLAFDSTALPETIADGGVVTAERSSAVLAEMLAQLVSPGPIREGWIARGRDRVANFSIDRFRHRCSELLFTGAPNIDRAKQAGYVR